MDPLSSLSLAGTVVQFVQFAGSLVNSTEQILRSASGASDEVQRLDEVYGKLSEFSKELCQGGGSSAESPVFDADLLQLASTCRNDCEQLLATIDTLRIQQRDKKRWWRSAQKALLESWKRDDILRLQQRIRDVHNVMVLKICTISSTNIDEIAKTLKTLKSQPTSLSTTWFSQLTKILFMVTRIQGEISAIRHTGGQKQLSPEEIENLTTKVIESVGKSKILAREYELIASLDYDHRSARHGAIPAAHQRTFQWIFESSHKSPAEPNQTENQTENQDEKRTACDETGHGIDIQGRFLSWLANGNEVFWITGKPGSGKSTLMKYIASHPRTRSGLAIWAAPKTPIIACHYFWSPGTPMQKSQEGLLRSILSGILCEAPHLLPETFPDCWTDSSKFRTPEWSVGALLAALHRLSRLRGLPYRFCLFIDGLDEYEGDHQDMCEVLSALSRSPYFKLCVSSRPWNVFTNNFGSDERLVLPIHELTRGDIATFANDRLRQHPRWARLEVREESASTLINEITDRADGVFLWVFLVIGELRAGLTNDDNLSDLTKRLESLPTDLERFFKHILYSVEPIYHEKMAGILRIALAAEHPLQDLIYVLHEKEYEDADYALKTPVEVHHLDPQSSTRINALCKGLLELRPLLPPTKDFYVEFLHRTVRDFLRTGEMMDFLHQKSKPEFRPHLSILRAHVAWMKRTQFPGGIFQIKPGIYSDPPAASALHTTLGYASVAEEEDERATHALLDNLEWSLQLMAFTGQLHFSRAENEFALVQQAGCFFRQLVLRSDLPAFVSKKMVTSPTYLAGIHHPLYHLLMNCTTKEDHHRRRRPKWTSWTAKRVKSIKLLLDNSYKPNETVISVAGNTSTAWTELLSGFSIPNSVPQPPLEYSADIEDQEQKLFGALELRIFTLLLDYGADPNAQIDEGLPAWIEFFLFSMRFPRLFEQKESYLQELRSFITAGAKPCPRLLDTITFKAQLPQSSAVEDDAYSSAINSLGEPRALKRHFCNAALELARAVDPDIAVWLGVVDDTSVPLGDTPSLATLRLERQLRSPGVSAEE